MTTPKRNRHKDKKGDKKDKKNQPHDPAENFNMNKRARRDVRMSVHPQLAALARMRAKAIADYRENLQRSNSVFGQEQRALAPLAGQFDSASGDILGNLRQALSAFGGTTGGNAGENALAGQTMNAGATGALGVLGAGQESDLAALQAARAGAAMQKQEMGSDILGNRQDALDQLRMQRADVFSQMPALIRQRADELQQSAFERSLAMRQFLLNRRSTLADIANNKALQDFMRNNLSSLLGGGPGGGGGNFGGGGPPGPGGTGPNTPGGRDTAGHGHGNLPPPEPYVPVLQQFASGDRPWAQIGSPGRQDIRQKIEGYFKNNRMDPAFRDVRHQIGPPNPMQLIMALRRFYYGPHHPGSPGGKPLP